MRIQCFIFNWNGQYEKVIATERQLKSILAHVTVINSDETVVETAWTNLGDKAYFTKQFLTAIDQFNADVLFHIQGDATYSDWQGLIDDARKYFDTYQWGIYAPNVDYTFHDTTRVDLDSLSCKNEQLKVVSCTDCTCWFLHRDIIERFRNSSINLSNNTYGWGIDVLFAAFSFLMKRPVLRDYAHIVNHPKGTGYPFDKAGIEMQQLFESLEPELQEIVQYIRSDKEHLANYLM